MLSCFYFVFPENKTTSVANHKMKTSKQQQVKKVTVKQINVQIILLTEWRHCQCWHTHTHTQTNEIICILLRLIVFIQNSWEFSMTRRTVLPIFCAKKNEPTFLHSQDFGKKYYYSPTFWKCFGYDTKHAMLISWPWSVESGVFLSFLQRQVQFLNLYVWNFVEKE